MPTCVKCTKAVYPLDRQINLDGKILHNKCAKCADCSTQITLSNFHIFDDSDGKVSLLCRTHYVARFKKDGVYVGADKFKKKAGAEVIAASAVADTTPSKDNIVKSTIWSPTGPSQANDANYELDRSVTTPDRRPSLRQSIGGGSKSTTPKDGGPSGADLLAERRASLKSVESKANAEISEEARRSSISRSPGFSENASAGGSETSEADSAAPADTENTAAPTEAEKTAATTSI